MARTAKTRDSHLAPAEIATEALAQFDAGTEPTIRGLAKALAVQPTAIYHHVRSRAEIVQAAADLVWLEVPRRTFADLGDPLVADPRAVLVASALATRRAFVAHHRIAPYLAATPQPDALRIATLKLVADVLERLGLSGAEAAAAFHAYSSFVIGSSLFVAGRLNADEQLDVGRRPFATAPDDERSGTRTALDAVMTLSTVDPEADERLFLLGLERLLDGLLSVSGPASDRS